VLNLCTLTTLNIVKLRENLSFRIIRIKRNLITTPIVKKVIEYKTIKVRIKLNNDLT
jgi:hypothetical protein